MKQLFTMLSILTLSTHVTVGMSRFMKSKATIQEKDELHYLHVLISAYNNEELFPANLVEAIAKNRKKAVLKLLNEADTDINKKDSYGWTPLLLAIFGEKAEIALLLLDHVDIDVYMVDRYHKSPYHWALKKGLVSVAQKILTKQPPLQS